VIREPLAPNAIRALQRWDDDGGNSSLQIGKSPVVEAEPRAPKGVHPRRGPRKTARSTHAPTVCFIGSYSPRRCGIATFTQDLSRAMVRQDPATDCSVIAMSDPNKTYAYPPEVAHSIDEESLIAYHRAADLLNDSPPDVVCLQHEFGIFGGVAGGHALALLRRLSMPIVTTLHTVLATPSPAQRSVTSELCDLSERLVVMSTASAETLHLVYGVPLAKIDVISHGAPAAGDRDRSKAALGLKARPTLLTFGLLSPDKGIEYGIEALPGIVERYPRVAYVVLGATHPHVRAEQGERYRESLAARAEELGVGDNVVFHDRFATSEELTQFLSAADIYLTPYLSTTQSTSGTLAYAVGAGRAVISTPFPYAKELLADGRGVLVPTADSAAITDAVLDLLGNHRKRSEMERESAALGRTMGWDHVAASYLDSFRRAVRAREKRSRAMPRGLPATSRGIRKVDLGHLRTMTDDTGLLQHAHFCVPRYSEGYCLDDNARALLLLVRRAELRRRPLPSRGLATRYLSFIDDAFVPASGRFRNFMSHSRHWLETHGSEDSHGRALWALGTLGGSPSPSGHRQLAASLFERALPASLTFDSPRAWAYTLLGLDARSGREAPDRTMITVRRELASRLFQLFADARSESWPWGEDTLTYCNARLPEALIATGARLRDPQMVAKGLRSLRWLAQVQSDPSDLFAPVGSNGFFPSNGTKAAFDQQPVEACAMISACLLAHRTTGDHEWLQRSRVAFDWFLGANHLGRSLYDESTGGCRDGIHEDRVNENQGAESTLSFLLALVDMRWHEQAAPNAIPRSLESVAT